MHFFKRKGFFKLESQVSHFRKALGLWKDRFKHCNYQSIAPTTPHPCLQMLTDPLGFWLNCPRSASCRHFAWKTVPVNKTRLDSSPGAPFAVSRDTSTAEVVNFLHVRSDSGFKGEFLGWVNPLRWEAGRGGPGGRKAGWSRDTVAMAMLPGKDKRGNLWWKGNSWNRDENGSQPWQGDTLVTSSDWSCHSTCQATMSPAHVAKCPELLGCHRLKMSWGVLNKEFPSFGVDMVPNTNV